MSPTDGWLTKAEAATALGVDERTIERKARQGLLGAQGRPGFPTVYNPADVARLLTARRTGVRPVVEAAGSTANGNGHGALATRAPARSAAEQIAEAILDRLGLGPTGPTGPTATPAGPTTLWLTLDEAAELSGLPRATLHRFIVDDETLYAIKTGRGWRIRRRDLEAL